MRFQPSSQIQRQLMRHILEGRYAPGQSLPTIHELAKILQVSTKTVQKAVHGLSAEGLIEAKRGVGLIVKSAPASNARWKRVGLLYANPGDYLKRMPYPGTVIQALEKELGKSGISVLPCSLMEIERLNLLDIIAKRRLNAIVLFEVDSDPLILELRETRLPIVSLDYDAYRHGVPSVIFDNIHGTFQATRNLIDLGHRDIAFLRPLHKTPVSSYRSLDWVEDERLKGYRLAMQDAGLPLLMREYEMTPEAAQQMLKELFERPVPPSAAVCVSDGAVLLIASEAEKLNIRVPEDLSLTGFGADNMKLASGKVVSSVRVGYAEMGRLAGEILIGIMEGKETRTRRELLSAELVGTDTVAAFQPAVIARS